MKRTKDLTLAGLFFIQLSLLLVTAETCARREVPPVDLSYPSRTIQIPADLAAHDWAQTEWWYYSGHLRSREGDPYGFELSFFRRRTDFDRVNGLPLKVLGETGYMAHFAVVNERTGEYLHHGLFVSDGSLAHAATDRYEVKVLSWQAAGDENAHHLQATAADLKLTLELRPLKPPVFHGNHGIIPKGQTANYYLSYTRMAVTGALRFQGLETTVEGLAWFDHEYGIMGESLSRGWDWFGIQLDDNTEYMIYALHGPEGYDPASIICRIDPAGQEECAALGEATLEPLRDFHSPDTGAIYPSGWRLQMPRWQLETTIAPIVPDQEFHYLDIAYWEGSCTVTGRPASGLAYVELVGYRPSKLMEMGTAAGPQ